MLPGLSCETPKPLDPVQRGPAQAAVLTKSTGRAEPCCPTKVQKPVQAYLVQMVWIAVTDFGLLR
ncbi:MAG TPA: hypothetical protein VGX03_27630 [Candidatus Binatia bacterium]|nr:hypothetical protein [Candidatus Binatia bacterium]